MCLNPITIVQKGCSQQVACGRCSDCRRKKASDRQQVAEAFCEQCGDKVIMLTLTFSDENVPVYYFDSSERHEEIGESGWHSKYKYPISQIRRLRYYLGEAAQFREQHIRSDGKTGAQYVAIRQREGFNLGYLFPGYRGFIPCFSEEELVAPMIKRVRRRLEYEPVTSYKPELKFFYVEEYGGDTLRPHYHVLVGSTNTPIEILEGPIAKMISEDWESRYGRVRNDKRIRSREQATRYVTNYLTKSDKEQSPYVLAGILPMPKCRHSIHLGDGLLASARRRLSDWAKRKDNPLTNKNSSYQSVEECAEICERLFAYDGKSDKLPALEVLDDYCQAWQMYVNTPLGMYLDKLDREVFSQSYILKDGTLIYRRLPKYYRDQLFQQKTVTYIWKRNILDKKDIVYKYDDSVYSENQNEPVCLERGSHIGCYYRRVRVLDTDAPLYRCYCSHIRARWVVDHREDFREVFRRECKKDYPPTFYELVDKVADYMASQAVTRDISLAAKHLQSTLSADLRRSQYSLLKV